ncbi:MAG: OmpA family protein [Spirochaetaceae bacterium]|jgi:outer membrane protein OmpA-like peptidoglycan-associated protein|nr:OmpA family protein [Spirochaetaceae bacterium]
MSISISKYPLYVDTKIMRLFISVFMTALVVYSVNAEEFVFKHKVGDKFKTISTSREDVFVNGEFLYGTKILNRMASEVTDMQNGVAVHKALFQLAEERDTEDGGSKSFQWTAEYDSVFGRDASGKITIASNYVMPTVRNVPVFPPRSINAGETWEDEGCEVHDLGPAFGVNQLSRLPFTAHYTFIGERDWRGKLCKAVSISYSLEYSPADFLEDAPLDLLGGASEKPLTPLYVRGESAQIMYWDAALGQPVGAEEQFKLEFKMSDGNIYEFRGKAEAEIIESSGMDKDAIADDILRGLSDEGVEGADVRVVEEGVKINLGDIMFEPDTAILLQGEEKKLEKIGALLRKYPARDILVGGHAARAGGTERSRQQLSQERAAVIAAYLIEQGVRSPDRIIARGYGSQNPIAGNDTESGRQKNRRVEITLLEN